MGGWDISSCRALCPDLGPDIKYLAQPGQTACLSSGPSFHVSPPPVDQPHDLRRDSVSKAPPQNSLSSSARRCLRRSETMFSPGSTESLALASGTRVPFVSH